MGSFDLLRHSSSVEPNEPGLLVDVTPESARWEFISFAVRRLCAGDRWEGSTGDRETCLVLLSGRFVVTWEPGGSTEATIGPRASVFDGYPHAVYLPPGLRFTVRSAATRFAAAEMPPARSSTSCRRRFRRNASSCVRS